MFNMKVVATIFITLAILVAILSASPQLGGFFQSTKDKITDFLSPQENIERNISFSLTLQGYENITATAKNVNIFLNTKKFTASIKDGTLDTKGSLNVIGYNGLLSVAKNEIALEGDFRKIELENASLTFAQGPIKSSSAFENLVIDNLTLKELKSGAGGIVVVNGAETRFSKQIEISSPNGRFSFDSGLQAIGKAAKISIPEAKISIG